MERPGLTCFRRHQPDEIFPMLHFTTMRQSHWHAINDQRSHTVSFPWPPFLLSSVPHTSSRVKAGSSLCSVFKEHWSLLMQVNRISVLLGTKPQWILSTFLTSVDCIRLRLYSLTLFACWEVFCWRQEELFLDPSNTFPSQWSCSLIMKPCLFKDMICAAQTWVGPG